MKKTVVMLLILCMMMSLAGCQKDSSGTANNYSGANIAEGEEKSSKGPKRVYLAAPFFNDTEVKNVEYVENVLSEKGLSYFSPMRRENKGEPGTKEWAYDIYEADITEIKNADVVVVLSYGNYDDSGTSWECGYAVGIGKPVVLVHIDRNGDSNLMMHCGGLTNIYLDELADYDFDSMPVYEYTGKML